MEVAESLLERLKELCREISHVEGNTEALYILADCEDELADLSLAVKKLTNEDLPTDIAGGLKGADARLREIAMVIAEWRESEGSRENLRGDRIFSPLVAGVLVALRRATIVAVESGLITPRGGRPSVMSMLEGTSTISTTTFTVRESTASIRTSEAIKSTLGSVANLSTIPIPDILTCVDLYDYTALRERLHLLESKIDELRSLEETLHAEAASATFHNETQITRLEALHAKSDNAKKDAELLRTVSQRILALQSVVAEQSSRDRSALDLSMELDRTRISNVLLETQCQRLRARVAEAEKRSDAVATRLKPQLKVISAGLERLNISVMSSSTQEDALQAVTKLAADHHALTDAINEKGLGKSKENLEQEIDLLKTELAEARSLKESHEAAAKAVEELRRECQVLMEAKAIADTEIERREQALESLQRRIGIVESEVEEASSRSKLADMALQEERRRATAAAQLSLSQLQRHREELQKRQGEMDDVLKMITKLHAEKKRLQENQNVEMVKLAEGFQSQHKALILGQQNELETLRTEATVDVEKLRGIFQQNLEALRERLVELESQLERQRHTVEARDEQIAALRQEMYSTINVTIQDEAGRLESEYKIDVSRLAEETARLTERLRSSEENQRDAIDATRLHTQEAQELRATNRLLESQAEDFRKMLADVERQHDALVRQYESQIGELRASVGAKDCELQEMGQLRSSLALSQDSDRNLSVENRDLRREIDSERLRNDTEVERLRRASEAKDKELEEKELMRKSISLSKERESRLAGEVKELQHQLDIAHSSLQGSLERQSRDLLAQTADLDRLSSVAVDLEVAQTQLTQRDKRIEELMQSIGGGDKRMREVEAAMDDLREDNAAAEAAAETLRLRILGLESDVARLVRENEKLTDALPGFTETQEERDILEHENESLRRQLTEQNLKLREQEESDDDGDGEVDGLLERVSALQKQLTHMHEERKTHAENLYAELEVLRTENEATHKSKSAIEKAQTMKELRIEELTLQLDGLQSGKNTLEDQLKELQFRLSQFSRGDSDELSSLKMERMELTARVRKLQTLLEERGASLQAMEENAESLLLRNMELQRSMADTSLQQRIPPEDAESRQLREELRSIKKTLEEVQRMSTTPLPRPVAPLPPHVESSEAVVGMRTQLFSLEQAVADLRRQWLMSTPFHSLPTPHTIIPHGEISTEKVSVAATPTSVVVHRTEPHLGPPLIVPPLRLAPAAASISSAASVCTHPLCPHHPRCTNPMCPHESSAVLSARTVASVGSSIFQCQECRQGLGVGGHCVACGSLLSTALFSDSLRYSRGVSPPFVESPRSDGPSRRGSMERPSTIRDTPAAQAAAPFEKAGNYRQPTGGTRSPLPEDASTRGPSPDEPGFDSAALERDMMEVEANPMASDFLREKRKLSGRGEPDNAESVDAGDGDGRPSLRVNDVGKKARL